MHTASAYSTCREREKPAAFAIHASRALAALDIALTSSADSQAKVLDALGLQARSPAATLGVGGAAALLASISMAHKALPTLVCTCAECPLCQRMQLDAAVPQADGTSATLIDIVAATHTSREAKVPDAPTPMTLGPGLALPPPRTHRSSPQGA